MVNNTKVFFANPENFRYDAGNRRFYLSAILDWFRSDFGRSQDDQLRAIAPYLPQEAARRAAAQGSLRVSHLEYDWDLNDQATARTAQR